MRYIKHRGRYVCVNPNHIKEPLYRENSTMSQRQTLVTKNETSDEKG